MVTNNDIQPAERLVLENLEALKVYFDPLRLKIVFEMVEQPRTVHELAAALNVPFTRLYYHINLLEKHNIIRVVDTRAMSGAVEEKYYQVSAYQFIVPRHLLSLSNPQQAESMDLFLSAMLDETGADIRQSIQNGRINMEVEAPEPDALLLRRGYLRIPPEKMREFHQDLQALIQRYNEIPSSSDDPYYGVTVAVYPSALPDQAGETGDSTLNSN